MAKRIKPVVLLIMDGWGYSANPSYNAIHAAKKPFWDGLWEKYPHTFIRTSGAAVGLPSEQMGNSEVGHLNIGAGRVVYQEFTRVSRAIKTGSFFNNATLTDAVDLAISHDKAVHIIGLLSPGGVHSHEKHIHAMVELAIKRGNKKVYMHAFLDGRDTPPRSALASLQGMHDKFKELGSGRIASVIGRYYAMDRDNRWERVEASYDLITQGKGLYTAIDAMTGLQMAYERDESDEFIKSTAIIPDGESEVRIDDGDVIIFMNYRSDRARQITRPFIEPDFDAFKRSHIPQLGRFASLTEYKADFNVPVAFPPERLRNVFGEYLSSHGLRQMRIAETEKYAHVTFFFNGGVDEPFEGEDRILIPSPRVATYDLQPEMSAEELTDRLVETIEGGQHDVIICNYANPDMVGHTGNYEAAIKAIEFLDQCLERVVEAIVNMDGDLLITADHGNAEQMRDEATGQAHTAHTTNPVPLIYVGKRGSLNKTGSLCDLAPTMLHFLGLAVPQEMSGRNLVDNN